jgi:hypothetical protein
MVEIKRGLNFRTSERWVNAFKENNRRKTDIFHFIHWIPHNVDNNREQEEMYTNH